MARPPTQLTVWLKRGISFAGFLLFLAGLDWLWTLHDVWPRSATDFVPHTILEAVAVIIAGLYLVNRGR